MSPHFSHKDCGHWAQQTDGKPKAQTDQTGLITASQMALKNCGNKMTMHIHQRALLQKKQ